MEDIPVQVVTAVDEATAHDRFNTRWHVYVEWKPEARDSSKRFSITSSAIGYEAVVKRSAFEELLRFVFQAGVRAGAGTNRAEQPNT